MLQPPIDQPSFHMAVIMDGNGRWATERGLHRTAGHHEGAEAVRRIVEAAPSSGISLLTLYAFSSDNWNRPRGEVAALRALLERFLATETAHCVETGVRLNVIGRRDRLPAVLVRCERRFGAIVISQRDIEIRGESWP